MTALHVIVGAGPVGTALALRLAESGERVRTVTRSGGGPEHPGVERRVLDASDPSALAAGVQGAAVLYNCANPGAYPRWEREWPPLAASILAAAEASGAVLVTMSNLYGYGPVEGTMTRHTPLRPSDHKGALRVRMWQDALAAHEAGRIRTAEARASDYLGPTVPTASSVLGMYAQRVLAGRPAAVFADPDQPHSWAAVEDAAATLAALGRQEQAWGSAWIVPTAPPATVREVLRGLAARAGAGEPRLRRVPRWLLTAGGLAIPILREVTGVLYQFERPFVSDGSETTELLGVAATPWEGLLDATSSAWAARLSAS